MADKVAVYAHDKRVDYLEHDENIPLDLVEIAKQIYEKSAKQGNPFGDFGQ
jgi:hypothetical protein